MTMSDTKEQLVARITELEAEASVNAKNTQAIIDASDEASVLTTKLIESMQEDIDSLSDDVNTLSAVDGEMDSEGNTITEAQVGITTLRVETEAVLAQAKLDSESSEIETYRANPNATFPQKIADWLHISSNIQYSPDDIMVADIQTKKVQFHVRNSTNIKATQLMGINLINGDLAPPSPHVHNFYTLSDGDVPVCRCGQFQLDQVSS